MLLSIFVISRGWSRKNFSSDNTDEFILLNFLALFISAQTEEVKDFALEDLLQATTAVC